MGKGGGASPAKTTGVDSAAWTPGVASTPRASCSSMAEEIGGHSMPVAPSGPRDCTSSMPRKRSTWRSRSSVMKRITVVTTM